MTPSSVPSILASRRTLERFVPPLAGARLTARGYRGPGRGRVSYVEAPQEWRATSVQVCGLWPWAVGAGSPTIGVPLGRNLYTSATVAFDPLSWFTRARLILNPSAFVLGLPALGKSTLTRRLVIGAAGMGATPLILGDLKPDYVDVVRALGGQVIPLGGGRGSLNVLDLGAMDTAAEQLGGAEGKRLAGEAHARRLTLVRALVTVARGSRTREYEDTILSTALLVLARRFKARKRRAVPVLTDLLGLLAEGPQDVRAVALDRGDDDRYRDRIEPLLHSLTALVDGPLGSVFARQTSVRLNLDAPAVCIDVSGIPAGDSKLQAAVLLASWAEGFGAVEAANALADAGAARQRRFLVVLDELWRVLRAGEGLVDRVDELTRLNRNHGVGQVMITHSLADLRSMDSEADRAKARGFVERAGAVICGGLPAQELDDLAGVVPFSHAERDLLTSWSTPPGWGVAAEPPGLGRFVLKVGQRPGVPFHVDLTPAELEVNRTNKRWEAQP